MAIKIFEPFFMLALLIALGSLLYRLRILDLILPPAQPVGGVTYPFLCPCTKM